MPVDIKGFYEGLYQQLQLNQKALKTHSLQRADSVLLMFEKAVGTRIGYGTNGCTTACLKLLGTTTESKPKAEIRQGQKQHQPPNIIAKVH